MHNAIKYIQGYFKMRSMSDLFQRMRLSAVIIQRAVRVWLKDRHFL
jgi:hypothetical protein